MAGQQTKDLRSLSVILVVAMTTMAMASIAHAEDTADTTTAPNANTASTAQPQRLKSPPAGMKPTRALILVPGVGGTALKAFGTDLPPEGRNIWISVLFYKSLYPKYLYSKYNPATKLVECLESNTTIGFTSSGAGLDAMNNLDPDDVSKLLPTTYYDDMIENLKASGYEPGKSFFGFPYDWRQSNMFSSRPDDFEALVNEIYEETKAPIDILSHSMGGLTVKSWFAKYGSRSAHKIHTWITLSTPFQGVPGKSWRTLIEGDTFYHMSKKNGHTMTLQSPASYELLPSKKHIWGGSVTKGPTIEWTSTDGQTHTVTMEDSIDFFTQVNANNTDVIPHDDGTETTIQVPFNPDMYQMALEAEDIRNGMKEGPRFFYNMVGDGIDTPYGLKFTTPVDNPSDLRSQESQAVTARGDGTVPIESSYRDGLKAEYRISFPHDHVNIIKDNDDVYTTIHQFLGLQCSTEGNWTIGWNCHTSHVFATTCDRDIGVMMSQKGWTVTGDMEDTTQVLSGTRSVFSGSVGGNRLTGSFDPNASGFWQGTIDVTLKPDCHSFEGSFSPKFGGAAITIQGTKEPGSQCQPGETSDCEFDGGAGTRDCVDGYWANYCWVDQCRDGYSKIESPSKGVFGCFTEQPMDPEWVPGLSQYFGFHSMFLMAILITAIIVVMIYATVRFLQHRQHNRQSVFRLRPIRDDNDFDNSFGSTTHYSGL
eukprot:GFYU01001426.1.p1 GENE.GFYU01001426.1~~GFYU01001426.1.p1  ORF type:complete len:706 (-),score=145.65 GFYU01001426.1:223-2340(-)